MVRTLTTSVPTTQVLNSYAKLLREYRVCEPDRYLSTYHERDQETGYDNRGARLYDSEIGRFLGVDPLAGKYPSWSPYNYVLGDPVSMVDPDGMAPIGDYYDAEGNWLYNDGKNDDKVYRVTQMTPVDRTLSGTLPVNIVTLIGCVESVEMEFVGEANANNNKQSDGTIRVLQNVSDGEQYVRSDTKAIGGPWGKGSPENGSYSVHSLYDRGTKSGWYNKGMTREGVGFSLNLDPQFTTGRSLLRIHPDGGKHLGTQGCIGLLYGKEDLKRFKKLKSEILSNQTKIDLEIDIKNNPNNDGSTGKAAHNGE